jgi:hypothetical protein
MPNVKRTFTLPDGISKELDAAIPSRERSKFIAVLLQDGLREKKRQDLMNLLDGLPRKKTSDGVLSEDVLREIRDGRAQNILDNSQP